MLIEASIALRRADRAPARKLRQYAGAVERSPGMATVWQYAGWLVFFPVSVVTGLTQQHGVLAILGITGGLWVACGCRMLFYADEWPTFVRYWGWFMTSGIDKQGKLAQMMFGGFTALMGFGCLIVSVLGALAIFGRYEFT